MRKLILSLSILTILMVGVGVAPAADIDWSWLQPGKVINDPRGLLTPTESQRIESSAADSVQRFDVPIRVVVLPSLAEFGGQGMQVETFTTLLFEAITNDGVVSDATILLLLIDEERQLRVAIGSAWPSEVFTGSRRAVQQEQDRISTEYSARAATVGATDRLLKLIVSARSEGRPINRGIIVGGIALSAFVLLTIVILIWRRRRSAAGLSEAVQERANTLIRKKLEKGADPDAFDEEGYTAAIYAAGQGDVQTLRELHRHGADLGLTTAQGESPLYYAAQNGHAEVAGFLLSVGVPVDPVTVHNETPLLIAAREGHLEFVAGLLHAGADVDQQDNRGWGALMVALREKHSDVVNLLLNHNVDVNLGPKDGPNTIMMAVKQEDEDLVRHLIERGADVHHVDRDGMCALRIAVLRGNQPIARRLLNAGADVSAPFANKEKPLEMAERQGHAELAKYLKKREKRLAACMDILEVVARGDLERIKEIVKQVPASVNVHSKKSRWTPLLIAVRAGEMQIAATLLAHDADVHARSMEGKSAIAYAIDEGNLAMVKLLLEGGARIDQIDAEGADIQTYAAEKKQSEVADFAVSFVAQQAAGYALFKAVKDDDPPRALTLLKENPDCVDARTRHERWTPLQQAARSDNVGMVKLLVEFNAQPNLSNSRGMTPLMYSARNGNLDLVRMLLAHGADARLKSREGSSACELALERGHARVVMLLQEVEGQLADLSRAGFPGESAADTGSAGRALDIFEAVQEGDLNRMREVLGNFPACVSLRWGPSELTPLHMVISKGDVVAATMLVEAGADVNAPTREGRMPLHLAVGRANVAMVSLLVRNEADQGVRSQGQTPLQAAQSAGYDDIVNELCDTGGDVDG